jgi:fermentation-respiration switch protein FrsA (DUF1100 family)
MNKVRYGVVVSGLLACLLFTGGCSFLFYQPIKKQIYDPTRIGIEYQDTQINSADGRKLHAWVLPAKDPQKERGTILQFHGNGENMTTHFMWLAWATERGYNLITFDYSGYWDSEGIPGQKALNEDALAALEYANHFNHTRTAETGNKLLLVPYGQSLGGTVLLRALADFPRREELSVVVVESSFPSYQNIAREKLSLFWETWLFQPFAYLLVSDRYAPENKLPALTGTRFLVIHGTDDMVVPIQHGRRIFELLREPKVFWEVPGGRHVDSMHPRHGGIYRDMLMNYLDGLRQ